MDFRAMRPDSDISPFSNQRLILHERPDPRSGFCKSNVIAFNPASAGLAHRLTSLTPAIETAAKTRAHRDLTRCGGTVVSAL
jgi:hypothetical protein